MLNSKKQLKDSLWVPARIITISFAMVILVGTFLLMLPISSNDGQATGLLDALFTATSATCVTGLVVFDTYSKWTFFGKMVIITLIQIGGLGLVTFTTFFNLMLGKKLGLRSMQLAQESINSTGFANVTKLTRMVVMVSLGIEMLGALALSTVFVPQYGGEGFFISFFLAISAFCNAGFDVLGFQGAFCSLINYTDNFTVLGTIMLLIIVGGLGFVVWADLYDFIKTKTLTLHTRVVLAMTATLILAGTLMFLVFEGDNPATIGGLPIEHRLSNAMFQSVTLRTAGFNSVDFAAMGGATKVLSCILMFIGAAPGSTGGGIKVTTMSVIIMTVFCVVAGSDETIIFKRRVPRQVVYKALAIIMIGLLAVSLTSFMIISTMRHSGTPVTGIDAFFESISAFGTVGLSVGVTGIANSPSKLMLIIAMYLGRVGPVSFALSLAMRSPSNRTKIIPEGKILVG